MSVNTQEHSENIIGVLHVDDKLDQPIDFKRLLEKFDPPLKVARAIDEKETILIVDDDEGICISLSDILREKGHKTEEARTGLEALEKAQQKFYVLILLDIKLPDIEGTKLLTQIKERYPDTRIIMMTAYASQDTAIQALNLGASAYITKPFNMDEMLVKVRENLEKQRLIREKRILEENNNKLLYEYRERLKELNCLYEISKLFEKPDVSYDKITEKIVDLIPLAMRYPEVACASITLGDKVFQTDNFRETTWGLSCDIDLHRGKIGTIEIYYLEKIPESDDDPFHKEEKDLINALAERFTRVVERKRYEERLDALHVSALKLAEAKNHRDVIDSAIDAMRLALGFEVAAYMEIEDNCLVTVALEGAKMWGSRLPLDGRGVTSKVARTGRTILISDTRYSSDYVEGSIRALSELAVSVKVDDEVVAVLNVESVRANAYDNYDLKLLETLATHVASANSRIKHLEMLKASEERYRTLFESTREGIIITGPNERILSANQAAAEIFDLKSPKQLIGKTFVELQGEPEQSRALLRELLDKGYVENFEGAIIGKDGVLKHLQTSANIQRDEAGNILRIEGIFRDVTEKKLLEEELKNHMEHLQELVDAQTRELREREETLTRQNIELQRLDEIKSRFVSMVTHELRTPLVSITGYLELIRNSRIGEVPEKISEMLKVVERNTNRLARLTDDLLDQQRIDSGKLTIRPEIFKLQDIIEQVTQEVHPFLLEKDQVLNVRVPEDMAPVRVDKNRIIQVFINLLNNASKFSPSGECINMQVRDVGKEVEVQVSDNGIGIAKEDLNKIFKPFPGIRKQQINVSTGLGLSICKGIVELHGGRIWVVSEGEGKGSTFTFTIPKYREGE